MTDDPDNRRRADLQAVMAAHAAFYQAFIDRSFDAMTAAWAARLPIVCIHPGWGALVGHDAVMTSWRAILANPNAPAVAVDLVDLAVLGDLARVIAYERINDAVLIATNLLAREDGAWKMIHHQSGPTPPPTEYASPVPPHRLN